MTQGSSNQFDLCRTEGNDEVFLFHMRLNIKGENINGVGGPRLSVTLFTQYSLCLFHRQMQIKLVGNCDSSRVTESGKAATSGAATLGAAPQQAPQSAELQPTLSPCKLTTSLLFIHTLPITMTSTRSTNTHQITLSHTHQYSPPVVKPPNS